MRNSRGNSALRLCQFTHSLMAHSSFMRRLAWPGRRPLEQMVGHAHSTPAQRAVIFPLRAFTFIHPPTHYNCVASTCCCTKTHYICAASACSCCTKTLRERDSTCLSATVGSR